MAGSDVDALNAGFAGQLLEEYLESPEAVPSEWRALFESGDSTLLATQPGLVRLLEQVERRDGNGATAVEPAAPAAPAPAPEVDEELLGGVAAAMALVKANR